MANHWEILGLEPTGDALAIKKAYAGLLKQNRPDEQPDAYQALRQAYEWALSEAEWLRRAPQEADPLETDQLETTRLEANPWLPGSPQGEAASVELAAAPTEPAGEAGFEADRADALLERWAERLLDCEAQGLDACWLALVRELEALPLDEQGDASVLFADFALQQEALPTALLANLARYFRWGRDYRDAERLGPLRLVQLRERLSREAPTLFRDARQVERAGELLRLDWVLQHRGKLAGWLYAALAGTDLRRLLADTDDQQRRALEISFVRWEAVTLAARLAVFARLLFVLACALPLAYLLKAPGQDLADWIAAAGFFGAGYWLLAWMMARQLPPADYLQEKLSALRWMRSDSNRLIAAVALPLMVALIARDAVALPALQSVFSDGLLVVAALLVCAAAPLAWPANMEEPATYLPTLGALAFGLTSLTGAEGADWVVALGVAAAWVALAGWIYQQYHDEVVQFYRSPWAALRPRRWWVWVLVVLAFKLVLTALAFLFTLALPLTLRVLARYMSANTALLATGLAVALAILAAPGHAARASLVALVLAAAALTGLQALAERVSVRLFSRVPATFFVDDDRD